VLHERGECKPCAYFHHKQDGCRQGEDCPCCHLCGPEAFKERKKLKLQRMKAEKQLAARQNRDGKCGLGLNGQGRLRNGLKEKQVLWDCKDSLIINETLREGHKVERDASDDETTQAPSESEITDTQLFTTPPGPELLNFTGIVFAPPPGLERSGLSSTLAMHGLPPSPMCRSSMYGRLSEPIYPAYVNLPAPMNSRSEAVSVSFVNL